MVMPMAGQGSRFAKGGHALPKPLIELFGKPFFHWAARGVLEQVPQCGLSFVILEQHQREFDLGGRINACFPQARIVALAQPTSGSLETALLGLDGLDPAMAVIINDCDHAFGYSQLPSAIAGLHAGEFDGFLSHFPSQSANFSFARYGSDGALIETAEKRVISDRAIAGVYGFASVELLHAAAEIYRVNCPYPELFVSGVYDVLVAEGRRIAGFDLDFHVPFGTPAELTAALRHPERFEVQQ